MGTKLTVIVDNTAHDGMKGEWGLSILVEHNGRKILADAGASKLFSENMEKLGINIKDVDMLSLSHAHYDHANGIPCFLEKNSSARCYIQKSTACDCYKRKFLCSKYIGIPKNLLKDYANRIETVSGDLKLSDGVWLIPHKTEGLESVGRRERMFRRTKKGWKPDDFSHEQSLVLDTQKGLVIINCCSHGGVVNIINEVMSAIPERPVYGIIGGFHLYNKSKKEVQELAGEIKKTGIQYLCTGHCTGDKAYAVLEKELGERMHHLHVGLVMEF